MTAKPAGLWTFNYCDPKSGERVEIDARPEAPFYLEHRGRVYEFTDREFIAEPGMAGSVAQFYELMNRVSCPPIPQRPQEKPEPKFGDWTVEFAKATADRMDAATLRAACETDPQFAAALDSLKPAAQTLEGDSAAVKDAKFLIAAKNATAGQRRVADIFRWS